MPDGADGKQKLTSTVVVSQSFLKEQERREKAKERRLQRFRRSESDDEQRDQKRRSRDRNLGNKERRRPGDRESLHYNRMRNSEDDEDDEQGWQSQRTRDRIGRFRAGGTGGQRSSVFDRLDPGSIKSRLGQREEVEEEVETDPTDVPRGKRYFMHDDRGGSGGQSAGRRQLIQRQRSRSPTWKHDKFREVLREDKDREDVRSVIRSRQSARRTRSPVWKHDKFEEVEQEATEEKEMEQD